VQKTAIKTKGKAKGVSRRIRKHTVKRRAVKQPAAGRGKLFPATDATASKSVVPFALKPFVNEIPALKVIELQGNENKFAGEEIQVQLIQDLYPIISKHVGYKENKRWSSNTSTSEVLHDLLKKFDKLRFSDKPEGNEDYWKIKKEEGKYCIEIMNTYGDSDAIFIPLDFLSKINLSHRRLHEFLIYAFRLVNNINKVQLFDDWCKKEKQTGNHGMIYEYLLERKDYGYEDDAHELKHKETLRYYGPAGIPSAYCKLLNGGASLNEFDKQLSKFTPSNDFEKIAFPFLQATLALAKTKKTLIEYCEQPWNNGEATPMEYYACVWTIDSTDMMCDIFCEILDEQANNAGASPFCWTEILGNNSENEEAIDFCKKAKHFFETGRKMAHEILKKVKNNTAEYPLPLTKKKNGKRFIDILV